MVSTTEGDIEIDEVEIGDTVYAYDERTGEVEEHEVVNTFVHDDDQIVTLTIDGEVVETTPWHPFYTDAGWEDAGDLDPGDQILSLDGDYGVVNSIVIVDETQTMYDLDVETVDTFAVGDGAWVVHNCGGWSSQVTGAGQRVIDAPTGVSGIDAARTLRTEIESIVRAKSGVRGSGVSVPDTPLVVSILEAEGRWYIGLNSSWDYQFARATNGRSVMEDLGNLLPPGHNGHAELNAITEYRAGQTQAPTSARLFVSEEPCTLCVGDSLRTVNPNFEGRIRDAHEGSGLFNQLEVIFPQHPNSRFSSNSFIIR